MAISLKPVFLQRSFECREEESPGNPFIAAMSGVTGPEKDGTIARQLYISSAPISAREMAIAQGSCINAEDTLPEQYPALEVPAKAKDTNSGQS